MFVKLINIVINGKRLTFLKNKKKHTSCKCLGEGFEKGQWDNLPISDRFMVADYLSNNSDFVAAEMRQACNGKFYCLPSNILCPFRV